MSWVKHPQPDAASTEQGRQVLSQSLERNRGEMGMLAAMFTFPALGDQMAQAIEQAHFGETALSRAHKEMLATLVSSANRCQY